MNARTKRVAQGAVATGVASAATLLSVGAASAAPTAAPVAPAVYDAGPIIKKLPIDPANCLACGLLGWDPRFEETAPPA